MKKKIVYFKKYHLRDKFIFLPNFTDFQQNNRIIMQKSSMFKKYHLQGEFVSTTSHEKS